MMIAPDREHLIAVALHTAAEGDPSLLNQLVAQIKATRVREIDQRIPGLEHAEGIADHWHQRFLLLRNQKGVDGVTSHAQLDELQYKAEGAKQVLVEIEAERLRLVASAP